MRKRSKYGLFLFLGSQYETFKRIYHHCKLTDFYSDSFIHSVHHLDYLCLTVPVAVISEAIFYSGVCFGLRGQQSVHLHHEVAGPERKSISFYKDSL